MFVSEEFLNSWFRTDSWIYKHFAYLFQNPLWNRKVPKGFSVCPFFHMSMFSMCILRPLIVPICLGFGKFIRMLLRLGGPHLSG